MAENIGSLEVDISIKNVNATEMAEKIATELKKVTKEADEISAAITNTEKATSKSLKTISEATTKTANDVSKVSEAAEKTSTATEKVSSTFDKVSEAAEKAAKASENLSNNLNTQASEKISKTTSDLATATQAATQATEKLADKQGEAAKNSKTFNELLEQVKYSLGQIEQAEHDQSGALNSWKKQQIAAIKEIIKSNEDLLNSNFFTDEQLSRLKEFQGETEKAATNTDNLSQAENKTAESGEKAAQATEKVAKTSKTAGGNASFLSQLLKKVAGAFGVDIPLGAKAAEIGIKAFQTAISAGILLVVQLLIEAITKLVDKLTLSFRLQGQLNEKVAESTAGAVANLYKLRQEWNNLENDVEKKEEFIRKNSDSFNELGVSIKNVNDAENLLVRNTNNFITALMQRARANAAMEAMEKNAKDNLEDLAKAEEKLLEAEEKRAEAQKTYDDANDALLKAEATAQFRQGDDAIQINKQVLLQQLNKRVLQQLKKGASQTINQENEKITELTNKRDEIITKIDKQNQVYLRIIENSTNRENKILKTNGFDKTKDLQDYESYLQKKKSDYADYAKALKSSDATVRANAAKMYQINISEGNTYLKWLKNQRSKINKETDNEKYMIVNRAINDIIAPKRDVDVSTYYQKLKQQLKEFQDQEKLGFKPDPQIIENLKKQIKLYEEANGITEKDKPDFSAQIAQYKEFAEKLVEIETAKQTKINEIQKGKGNQDDKQKAIENVKQFTDNDIEMLKQEYGIIGDDIAQTVLDTMMETISNNSGEITEKIIAIKDQIKELENNPTDEHGNSTDHSAEIGKLQAQLQTLLYAYNRLKGELTGVKKEKKDTDNTISKEEAYKHLKTTISNIASSFQNLGSKIGGSMGEALSFVGDLTNNVMGTINAIQAYAEFTSKTIIGVGNATKVAIKTVETASVILAVISAAMEIAMKLVELFSKDKETYADKKDVYDAYISTLDIIIDREKKLAETLTAQQAAAQYDAIGEHIKQQEEATRKIGKDYLNSGAKWNSHSEGVKNYDKMDAQDFAAFEKATGVSKIELGGRLTGLFDLTAEQIKNLQYTSFYAKLDSETRGYLEKIVDSNAAAAQNIYDSYEAINGISFDGFSDNFLSSLKDMDVKAEDVAGNIKDYMRQSLIEQMFKKDYQQKIDDYYKKWGEYMESGDELDENEMKELNELADQIANGATAAAQKINEAFKTVEDEAEEEGLSGAIKNASQESIDLLAGQTNAVRMNQVTAMEIAREQIAAVMEINMHVIACVNYLSSINSNLANPDTRSQGII